jgi:hypothetical protein
MVRVVARKQSLPAWIEANVCLPAGAAAEPGPIKLYPFQRGILEAIADPKQFWQRRIALATIAEDELRATVPTKPKQTRVAVALDRARP